MYSVARVRAYPVQYIYPDEGRRVGDEYKIFSACTACMETERKRKKRRSKKKAPVESELSAAYRQRHFATAATQTGFDSDDEVYAPTHIDRLLMTPSMLNLFLGGDSCMFNTMDDGINPTRGGSVGSSMQTVDSPISRGTAASTAGVHCCGCLPEWFRSK